MNLQQRPLFFGDLAGVEEGAQCDEFIMESRANRFSSTTGAVLRFSHSNVLSRENQGAESLQPAIIMMPYVSERLAGLFRDFAKTVTLEKVKFQCEPLFCGKLLLKAIQECPTDNLVNKWSLGCGIHLLLAQSLGVVMLPERQVLAAIDSPMVGDLNDPRRRGSLASIKKLCFLEKKNEDLLTKVLRLRGISQDS